jgi:hypothetical protein
VNRSPVGFDDKQIRAELLDRAVERLDLGDRRGSHTGDRAGPPRRDRGSAGEHDGTAARGFRYPASCSSMVAFELEPRVAPPNQNGPQRLGQPALLLDRETPFPFHALPVALVRSSDPNLDSSPPELIASDRRHDCSRSDPNLAAPLP